MFQAARSIWTSNLGHVSGLQAIAERSHDLRARLLRSRGQGCQRPAEAAEGSISEESYDSSSWPCRANCSGNFQPGMLDQPCWCAPVIMHKAGGHFWWTVSGEESCARWTWSHSLLCFAALMMLSHPTMWPQATRLFHACLAERMHRVCLDFTQLLATWEIEENDRKHSSHARCNSDFSEYW